MDSISALENFLRRALVRRQDRYITFIQSTKSRSKFQRALFHELQDDLDHNKIVDSLPDEALDLAGYLYRGEGEFCSEIERLRDIYESQDDSCLAISDSGFIGIYCPETFVDSRCYLMLESSS